MSQPLLEVNRLKKHFPIKGGFLQRAVGHVHAVDGVSFHLDPGETIGLVGESGCGKSTTGRLILRLIKPTSGEIRFNGQQISRLDRRRMKAVRRDMQLIFQDPFASLNPRLTVGGIVAEAFKIHGVASGAEIEDRTADLLKRVGLHTEHLRRYPHEFSGGQRQRIGIARALALNPKLIIADEPVSALDVSIQAQVINLLQDLKGEFQLSYIIIAHDLSVVEYMSDRVAVMYLGKIVEMAPGAALYSHPRHPYTEALLSAIPIPNPRLEKKRRILQGDVPSPINPPPGCRFHTRCSYRRSDCERFEPELIDIGGGHHAACPVRAGGSFLEEASAASA
ncbi:MAG: dipeptide ABC transporter ATP-binding protein [Desulfobacterales bacterium]|jgi:oligopeptide transport system ATP-binding protein|nr:dipeptide ABC transporter ATP-binding protein [Desulfobacterales bacterium]